MQEIGAERASYHTEQRYQPKDGTTLWARVALSRIQSTDDETAYVALIENVTQRKALEQQLVASQKMEAVGRLAAGIAHDFNNVLTVITGYTSLMLARTPPEGVLYKEITEISEASQRATALTKRLLAFSRQQVEEPRVLDLNKIITGIEPMLRRVIGEHLRLTSRLESQSACIKADQVHLEQVLMNFVINARDAIGSSDGTITILTNHEDLDDTRAATLGVPAGPYIALSVKDTGHGMDEKVKARIFEPFFTTKDVGKGTGLGLWTVREIVQQSKGAMTVQSQPGRGTTFTIWFPETRSEAEAVPVLATGSQHTGTETILVVDDDEDLRELMKEVLTPAGYQPIVASNGEEALQLAARHHVDLLITDLSMPAMMGTDVAKRTAALHPDVKVLYVSGYDQPAANNQTLPGRAYLQKPFTSQTLLQRIRDVFEMPRQAVIVIADDDPGIRKLLREILRPSGYRILEAANGKHAVEHLNQERVDLLITDLMMPEQEGMETIRAVRKRFPQLRIVAMSGGFGTQFLNIAHTMGAHHIMRKPFEAQTARDVIRQALS
jgi:two-component system, cell cycle sensor histidine kinase and response regulator CckA